MNRPKWPQITWTSCLDQTADRDAPRILGCNPWVYDFAAYNLWSRPAGLLACLHMMARAGAQTALVDCMHPMWSDVAWPRSRAHGHGPWPKTPVPPPAVLADVPRRFSRYGLDYDLVAHALHSLQPQPDLVLISTGMTYWYPGAVTMARLVRSLWPRVPILAGGVYATLCPEHARSLDCFDQVLPGPLEQPENWNTLWSSLGCSPPPLPEQSGLALDLGHYRDPEFSIVMGSRGCPYTCAYCANPVLNSGFRQKSSARVRQEVDGERSRGVQDFAFYDDALLVRPQTWLLPLLSHIGSTRPRVRLHTPNALHLRHLTPHMARLLKQAGLHTVRLGLESSDFSHRLDTKLTEQEWKQGVQALFAAGFEPEQIGAYILFGLPEQDSRAVQAAIDLALRWRIRPHLAQYSPIPGTELFAAARANSPYPLAQEPLCHNNALWPCVPGGFTWERHMQWKEKLRGG